MDDIAGCFGGCAEEGRRFTPTHLERGGDYNLDVVQGGEWFVAGQHVTKIPCIFWRNHHSPESILDVDFCKGERLLRVAVVCHGAHDAADAVSQLYHAFGWCLTNGGVVDRWDGASFVTQGERKVEDGAEFL